MKNIILFSLILNSPFIYLYLYNYQKKVRDHINQNDEMYKMILEMYNKSKIQGEGELNTILIKFFFSLTLK